LHAHAQNDAIFPPKSGEKPYLKVLSRFGLWRDFLDDNIQATISAFRLIKNMSINPKSVEFHQCHSNPYSICFLAELQRAKRASEAPWVRKIGNHQAEKIWL